MGAMIGLATLAACAEKPTGHAITGADPDRGLTLIQNQGCGACHQIPGVAWPRGEVGGSLAGFADRALIAGRHPNQPEVLVRWLRDPPALSPDTAMPASNLTEPQARDIAAYLRTLHDD
jgi:mono/diheme cytochrome c family protein